MYFPTNQYKSSNYFPKIPSLICSWMIRNAFPHQSHFLLNTFIWGSIISKCTSLDREERKQKLLKQNVLPPQRKMFENDSKSPLRHSPESSLPSAFAQLLYFLNSVLSDQSIPIHIRKGLLPYCCHGSSQLLLSSSKAHKWCIMFTLYLICDMLPSYWIVMSLKHFANTKYIRYIK